MSVPRGCSVSVLVSRCRCFILSVWLSLTLCSDRSSTALDVTTATVAPVSVELVCVLGCGFDGGQWCWCCGAALFVAVLVSRCRCFILSVWLSLTLCSDRWSTVDSTSTSGSASAVYVSVSPTLAHSDAQGLLVDPPKLQQVVLVAGQFSFAAATGGGGGAGGAGQGKV